MKYRLFLALLLIGVIEAPLAEAYPTFIRHEYKSCTSCHWNPRGGGLLTDYGQGIAGALSAFPVDYEGPPDSPLYRALTADKAITHGAFFRLMTVKKEGRRPATFPMQLDYLHGTKFSEKTRFEGALGIHVKRDSAGSVRWNTGLFNVLTLRQALLAVALGEGREISAGRDFLPVGLGIDDHTALVRTKNRRGVVDYPTQVRLDRWNERLHWTPYLFAPSGEEAVPNREYGLGSRLELYPLEKTAVGGTVLLGRSSAVTRELLNIFSRWSPLPALALLFEYDFTLRQTSGQGGASFTQHVVYFRPSIEPVEWIEAGPVLEYQTRQAPFAEQTWGYGLDAYFRLNRQFTVIMIGRQTKLKGGGGEEFVAAQLFAHL